MDVSEATPRVNFELMQRHMHRKVLLVGQIEGIENNVARVRAADGGTVQVMTKPGGVFDTQFVQFEGIVESPTQLSEVDHTSFGVNLGNNVLRTGLLEVLPVIYNGSTTHVFAVQIWASTMSYVKYPTRTFHHCFTEWMMHTAKNDGPSWQTEMYGSAERNEKDA